METLEQRIEALNNDVQSWARQNEKELAGYYEAARSVLAGIPEDRLAVMPVLVPSTTAALFARYHRAFKQVLDLIFEGRLGGSWFRLAEALRLEAPSFRFVDPDRRPRWLTMARPDVVVHGNAMTMVEPNAGSSCGGRMTDADILGRLFEESPLIRKLLNKFGARRSSLIPTVAADLRSRLVAAGQAPDDALVVVAEFRADFGGPDDEYHRLARELRAQGMRAEAGAVEDLDVDDDGVAYAGERCALIYRFAGEEPDPAANYPVLAPILAAGRHGRVVIVDELDDAIALNKTILATVSEELDAGRLPRDLTECLAGFVPWTRVLEETYTSVDGRSVDLPAWCMANREALVLKPGAGYQGRGVTIGCETDPAQWADAVGEALSASEAWLVQRLARSRPATASTIRGGSVVSDGTYVDYSYFAIGGNVPAAIVRKSARFGFGSPSRRVKYGPYGPVYTV
jgi:hypothetical protein